MSFIERAAVYSASFVAVALIAYGYLLPLAAASAFYRRYETLFVEMDGRLTS